MGRERKTGIKGRLYGSRLNNWRDGIVHQVRGGTTGLEQTGGKDQSAFRRVKTEMPATSKWRYWADWWTSKRKDQRKGPEEKWAWGSLAHKWFLKPGAERNHFQDVWREKSIPTLTGLVIGPEIYLPMAIGRTLK